MSHIIECRRRSCCHSRASRCGPPRPAGEAGQLRGGRFCSGALLHSDTVKDSSVIIAYNRRPGCSVAAMVVASRSPRAVKHLDGQLLQAPVTLGPFMTTLRTHLGCCQPRCLNVCLPIPASLIDKDPHSYGLSGWPSGHLLRSSLNGVLPQTQRIPMPHGLEPASP
jgi:hypothetical protein